MHPLVVLATANTPREEWLEIRRKYFTATDRPKVTGSSRFGKAADVLLDKQGLSKELDQNALPLQVGKLMEPHFEALVRSLHRQFMAEFPGSPELTFESQVMLGRGHCAATMDLIGKHGNDIIAAWEFKVSIKPWHDQVPKEYEDQVDMQIAVIDLELGIQILHYQVRDWQETYDALMDGTFVLNMDEVETYVHMTTPARRAEILNEAEAWLTEFVDFGTALPTSEKSSKPKWEGSILDEELALEFSQAKQAAEDAKANLESYTAKVKEIQAKVEERLGDALELLGIGFTVQRTYTAGRKMVAYDKAIAALRPSLTPELTEALDKAIAAHTSYAKPSIGLALKEV